MNKQWTQLQTTLGITFLNHALLRQAFTHSSYVNERKSQAIHDNERLEFLGDAVLELAVSDYLFNLHPHKSEGELTKLRATIVCEPSLAGFAETLRFGEYVMLGRGEEMTGGRSRPALLADVFESFVGALYLDGGLLAVKAFLNKHIFSVMAEEGNRQTADFKSQMQEYTQQLGLGALEYRIVEENGPAHERIFVVELYMGEERIGSGSGKSKKEAEQQSASQALVKLGVIK